MTTSFKRWLTSPDALRAIETERQRRDFALWLEHVTPTWQWHWRHLALTREYLNKVTCGEIKRLMIFEPPRHGKSEMVTVRYPVWRLMREPELRVILGAYNQFLANTFSRKSRRIARTCIELSDEREAVESWETAAGGGFRAVGVGGGITGQGAQLIVIDDPTKSREEANSPAYQERCWDWFTNDLYTRLEPCGAIILIMTRWSENDLAGRILASESAGDWTVLSLPAEAEQNDPLGRAPGEPLCPERYDAAALADIRTVLGSWAYAALYQQRPRPLEGGQFKREWFAIVDEAPGHARAVRAWDLASTEPKPGRDPDYTSGIRMAALDGRYWIVDMARTRGTPLAIEQLVAQCAELDGHGTPVYIEQEPGQSGVAQISHYQRNVLPGYAVRGERATGAKELRAEPFAAAAEAGNVMLVRGGWNAAFLEELTQASGAHDDIRDSCSLAFSKVSGRAGRPRPAQVMVRRG